MAEGKCVGACQHPGCWEAGKGSKRTDNVFYASVLRNILFKRQANLLNCRCSPETAHNSSSLPSLTVNTLSSEQCQLPSISRRRSIEPSGSRSKGKRRNNVEIRSPPVSQACVHQVQLCVDQSPHDSRPQWSDYDFTPVYIWMPKHGNRAKHHVRSLIDNDSSMKTTYLNDVVSLPNYSNKKKKKRSTKSPANKWYGDLTSEFYSDLLNLSEDQVVKLMRDAHLSVSSRNENRQDLPTPPQCARTVKHDSEGERDQQDTSVLDKATEDSTRSSVFDQEHVGKEISVPDMCTTPKRVNPEKSSDSETSRIPSKAAEKDKDLSPSISMNVSLSRSRDCITRYPHGNPALCRIPRTACLVAHPLSLQSSDYYSTMKIVKSLEQGLTDNLMSVTPCPLSARKMDEHKDVLPPLPSGTVRVPPPTANQPKRTV